MNSLSLPDISYPEAYRSHFNDAVWLRAAAAICARHRLAYTNLRRSNQGENIIFHADNRLVIKIYAPFRTQQQREAAALEFAHGKLSIETPEVVQAGEFEGLPYLVMTELAGINMREVWPEVETPDRAEIVVRLAHAMRELHEQSAELSAPALNRDWHGFLTHQARISVEKQRAEGANRRVLDALPAYIDERLAMLPADFNPVLLHGDIHPGNVVLIKRAGRWQAAALFDFGDSFCGFYEYEFVTPCVLMIQGLKELQREMLRAYGYREADIDESLRARLMLLTVLYEYSDLRKYALRLKPEAVNYTLDELERAVYTFA
jgi:hygromycin-B 7''-O-kinase